MKSGCGSDDTKTQKARRSIPLPVLAKRTDPASGIKASKASRWRAIVLITLNLLMIAHFVQWQMTGSTVSPIEPSESMYTLQSGAINAGFIFFTLAILATLIFGRFVCGWGCHILALQDLCAWLLKKIGLTPKPFRSRLLVFVPLLAALYMFVWPTVYRVFLAPQPSPVIPNFTNHIITTEFWQTFPPLAVAIPFLFICGFLIVYFLGSKGFCTYGCPYGGFFSLADQIAPGKIRVTDACNQCGHCTATCTSNVLVHSEVKEFGMVVDSGCMKCMDCISVCPNDALYFGFGKPAIAVPKAEPRTYSLTWPEEALAALVFAASYLAVWDVYQLIPMLMSLGIAGITTFLATRSLQILRTSHSSFYRYNLRSSGKIRIAGWIFLGFSTCWIGLNAHSGFVRYHERAGAIAFQNLQIPDELALARTDLDQWLSPADRRNIIEGKQHFDKAWNIALLTNVEVLPKLAWFEYLSGNTDRAIELLDRSSEIQEGQAKALSLYYRGAILNRVGRYEEASLSLDRALAERPDLALAREEKGESLWLLGRKAEAVTAWADAIRSSPGLPLANNMLAGSAASMGQPNDALAYEKQADQNTPADPLFHWMVGLRLQNVGMNSLADKHFKKAAQLDSRFRARLAVQ